MPSSSYYRRQAKTLFSLSLVTSDPAVASSLANLAKDYQLLAEAEAEDERSESNPPPSDIARQEPTAKKKPAGGIDPAT